MRSKPGQNCAFTQWEHMSITKIEWAGLSSHRMMGIGYLRKYMQDLQLTDRKQTTPRNIPKPKQTEPLYDMAKFRRDLHTRTWSRRCCNRNLSWAAGCKDVCRLQF